VWIAVPAFFMGFPFPYALGQLRRKDEIPWALALNGFGSVLGSLGATLVAVHFGLTSLALAGVGLYVVVAVLLLASKSEVIVPATAASSG
jgi:predicted MFS family arabinose efflux permease